MSNHTPEPWEYVHEHGAWEGYHEPESGEFEIVFRTDSEANAARIVECVNACEGQTIENVRLATAHREACILWETEMMKAIGEDGVGSVVNAIKNLQQQREELLEALEELVEKCLHTDGYNQKIDELFKAQQAIKKAKGE